MSRRPSSTTLLALAFLGFVSLGLPDGLLGVAAPSIRASFAVAPEEFGALLVAFAAGYLSSSFASGAILARIGVGTLLALSCLLTAASLAMYAAAPWWWWMVAGGSLSGLGAGAIDSGINTYAATRHSPRTVNWLHACYGVGAMSGPVLMTSVLAAGRSWRFGYALVGAAQLALAAAFAATRTFWPSAAAPDDDAGSEASADAGDAALPARVRQTLARPVVWLGIAIFLVYTGLEATVAVWGFSFLTQARGIALTTAGWWLSGFWLGLTAGRVAFGWVVGRVPIGVLMRSCAVAIAGAAALLWADLGSAACFLGVLVCGLAMAPVFPSLIATTPARVGAGHAANAVGFQIAAAAVGASFVPSLVGVAVGRAGIASVAPALVIGGIALLALQEVLHRGGDALRRRAPHSAAAISPRST
ncbi:MAG TPA: MFS transporter [Candidatus Binatia bacterium]|nr:MFS transporter [Candidatus Binatia bacterium]